MSPIKYVRSIYPILLLALTMRVHAMLPLRILTHNIRYAASPPASGEEPWTIRKQLILNELIYNTLYNAESFICLQEVLHEQLQDILCGLGNEWAYLGVGRDDGQEAGEYSPILYRKAVWEVVSWRTVWLNEKQTPGEKGWDAGSVRILTIGTFRHVQSKKLLVGLNTHLDNVGAVSRRESARIILRVLANVTDLCNTTTTTTTTTSSLPFFLAGDLNSEMDGEAYQMLNGGSSRAGDAKQRARWRYGEHNTFTGFEGREEDLAVIDFVFLGPEGVAAAAAEWAVEGYGVLPNSFEDGVFASDHRAVVVDAVLQV